MNNDRFISDTVSQDSIDRFVRAVFLPVDAAIYEMELFRQYSSLEGARRLLAMLNLQRAEIISVRFGLQDNQYRSHYETGLALSERRSHVTVRNHLIKALTTMLHEALRLQAIAQAQASGVTPIRALNIQEHTANRLIRTCIDTVEELQNKTADDLLSISNFSDRQLTEVERALAELKPPRYLKGEGPQSAQGRSGDRDGPDPGAIDLSV
jgi:hypothetical protein